MKWINEVFKNIITQFASSLLVSIVAGFGITTWIKGSKLFQFLTQPLPIKGWVVVLVSSVLFGFILFLFLLFLLNRKNRSGIRNYLSYGLFWDLTPQFFQNYDQFTASSASSIFVRSCILGPYCPKCNVDVTNTIAGGSFVCMNGHDLKNTEAYKILDEYRRTRFSGTSDPEYYWDIIRKNVYAEAQGKARNGLL